MYIYIYIFPKSHSNFKNDLKKTPFERSTKDSKEVTCLVSKTCINNDLLRRYIYCILL